MAHLSHPHIITILLPYTFAILTTCTLPCFPASLTPPFDSLITSVIASHTPLPPYPALQSHPRARRASLRPGGDPRGRADTGLRKSARAARGRGPGRRRPGDALPALHGPDALGGGGDLPRRRRTLTGQRRAWGLTTPRPVVRPAGAPPPAQLPRQHPRQTPTPTPRFEIVIDTVFGIVSTFCVRNRC